MLSRTLAARLTRPVLRVTAVTRNISSTPRCLSAPEPSIPIQTGPGTPPGRVPTDEEQATGPERLQLLGRQEGIDVFERKPDFSKKGTMADPVLVPSLATTRIIGCTGYPPEEHRTLWLTLHNNGKKGRCIECGNVFKLDFQGIEDDGHHH